MSNRRVKSLAYDDYDDYDDDYYDDDGYDEYDDVSTPVPAAAPKKQQKPPVQPKSKSTALLSPVIGDSIELYPPSPPSYFRWS